MTAQDSQGPNYFGFGLSTRPPLSARELGDNKRYLQVFLDEDALASKQPFTGVTAEGKVVPNLFPLRKTGVPTKAIADAALAFLASLSDTQRETLMLPIDTIEWRRWSNISPFLFRHGLMLESLSDAQRELALRVLSESFSAQGYQMARDVMKLNYTVGEIRGNMEEYGDWVYWLSIMGQPSADEPWGWQIDGHHLNVNCFLVGGQMVMTPALIGSEPVIATSGKYAGTSVLQPEQDVALQFFRGLDPSQRKKATLTPDKPAEIMAGAYRDNLILRPEGLAFGELTLEQQSALIDLIGVYTGRVRPGHAEINLEEVKAHLSETLFAWIGGDDEQAVFYYRIHSPVILIEFDHQRGVAFDNKQPSRNHIHTMVRTPNGNDYGKDLLRQHHLAVQHN